MTQAVKMFLQYLAQRWWLLLGAMVTGMFTFHAAGYFWGSLLYQIMAVVFTEGALLVWVYRLEGAISWGAAGIRDNNETALARDNNEDMQAWISGIGASMSFLAIVLTDMASAVILASEGGLDLYASIPAWAQGIVVNLVWVLAAANVLLGGLYQALSPEAVLERVESTARRMERRASIMAERERALASARAYEREAMPRARDTGTRDGLERAQKAFSSTPIPPETQPRVYQADAENFMLPPKQ